MALSCGVHDNFISHTRQSSQTDIRELDNNEIALVSGQFAAAAAAPLLYTIAEYIAIGACAVGTILIAKEFSYPYGYNNSRDYHYVPEAVPSPPTDWDNWKESPRLVPQRCY